MPSIRVNITIDEEILAQADAFAEAHGFSRSGLFVRALRDFMEATEKGEEARASMSELFSIISDAFRAGTGTAELEQRTAALEQRLEALK